MISEIFTYTLLILAVAYLAYRFKKRKDCNNNSCCKK
ncbi:MAG: hypothetical protein KatS3mg028_0256 [Bacteroidia bacterium]|nr:MAG: hypothetical protein KatS3mg028_0256 [Bacteroidia bacterium]